MAVVSTCSTAAVALVRMLRQLRETIDAIVEALFAHAGAGWLQSLFFALIGGSCDTSGSPKLRWFHLGFRIDRLSAVSRNGSHNRLNTKKARGHSPLANTAAHSRNRFSASTFVGE
jgi:hypothetical protein